MIQQAYKNNVEETSGEVTTTGFSIAVNESMFQMLTSNVYSDPILANIREWSTNACDACIEADKEVKFDVHVPTVSEPVFYVRDYGVGLTPEDIVGLFSTLGVSTKRNSDKLNGTLGIGRMAGLAVSNAFTVESFHEGTQYSYVISMQNGVPVTMHMGDIATNEPNGLKLSVSVNLEDISSYVDRVKDLYKYFDYKPNLNVDVDIHLDTGKKDWFIDGRSKGNYVLMSQVMYRIPDTDEFNDYGFKSVVIKAAPGSVTFNPGRESLSLNKPTLTYLQSMFDLVKKQFITQAIEEYQQKSSDVEIIKAYYTFRKSSPYSLLEDISPYTYLSDYAKALCYVSYNKQSYDVDTVTGNSKFYILTGGNISVVYKGSYHYMLKSIEDVSVNSLSFYCQDVVLMDKKSCSRKKLINEYGNNSLVVWCRPKGVGFDIYLKEAKSVLNTLGIKYKLYSDIVPDEEKEQTDKSLREGFFASPIAGSSVYKSECMSSSLVDNTDWLYLKLSGYTPQLSGTTSFETLGEIYNYLCKVTEMPNVKGVSKKYQQHIEGKSNWIDYETFIWEKLKEVTFVTDMEIPYKDITFRTTEIPENFPETIKKAHTEITNYAKARRKDNFIWTVNAPDVKEFKDRLVPYKPENPDFYNKLVREYPFTTKVLTGEVKMYDGVAQHALEIATLERRCNAIHKAG